MNAYERVRAMVNGEAVDRPGATVWHHFYLDDHNAYDNVRAHIAFEERNNWDVIKIMTNGVYIQEQYGAEISWSKTTTDFPLTRRRAVLSPCEFRSLKPCDVKTGALAREVEVARRLVDKYHGKVPVLASVFTPATMCQELYNGWQNPYAFRALAENYGDDLEEGIKVMTEVTYKLIEEYVAAGVDGIFYAAQHMYERGLTREQYERFGMPYDLQAIEPAVKGCWFNMLHVHGDVNMYFDIAAKYPLQAFNWEDVLSGITIEEVHKLLPDRIMVAGVDRHTDFRTGSREEQLRHMIRRVKDAAAQAPMNKLIIAGGCAQDTDIPDYRYDTLREAMETVFGLYDA